MRRVVAVALLAGAALGQVTVTRQFRRVAAVPEHGVVSVVHRYGDVVVTSTGGDSVVCVYSLEVTGTDPAAVRAFAAGVDAPVSGRAETVGFETEYPPAPAQDPSFGYVMGVELFVPERAGLSVANRFGDVTVAGFEGEGSVRNEYGDVEMERCGGCAVSNWYGDVLLSGNLGPAAIEHGFGRIMLSGLADRVMVNSRYGDVRAALADVRFGLPAQPETDSVAELALLSVMSEAGTVELELAGGMPYQLHGIARGGNVEADLPVRLVDSAGVRFVHGWLGSGGPEIDLKGNASSIIIRTGTGEPGTGESLPVRNRR